VLRRMAPDIPTGTRRMGGLPSARRAWGFAEARLLADSPAAPAVGPEGPQGLLPPGARNRPWWPQTRRHRPRCSTPMACSGVSTPCSLAGYGPSYRSPQWGLSTECLQARRSFSPVTEGPSHRSPTEGIGCGNKVLRTGHHKGGWVRYTPFIRFTNHLPMRCAAGGTGHALLSTKSLHPCTVAHFYALPLRPARSSAPRGSAPTARLPAAPPGSLSRPCLPTGLPSLPSPAAT